MPKSIALLALFALFAASCRSDPGPTRRFPQAEAIAAELTEAIQNAPAPLW